VADRPALAGPRAARAAPAGGNNAASAGRSDRPTRTGRIPLGRRGTLDDHVGAILFLISGLSAYVTGTDMLVDGGAAILR
jgi:3-oxoacyl-[acyl-carrier protein] reductase